MTFKSVMYKSFHTESYRGPTCATVPKSSLATDFLQPVISLNSCTAAAKTCWLLNHRAAPV